MSEIKLKETNSFYVKEDTDTRLKYSVTVPDDIEDDEEFKPKESFGFQENFRKTLGASKIEKTNDSDVKKYIPKHKSKEMSKKPKILLELKESLRILNNYDFEQDGITELYISKNMAYSVMDMIKNLPKEKVKKYEPTGKEKK